MDISLITCMPGTVLAPATFTSWGAYSCTSAFHLRSEVISDTAVFSGDLCSEDFASVPCTHRSQPADAVTLTCTHLHTIKTAGRRYMSGDIPLYSL